MNQEYNDWAFLNVQNTQKELKEAREQLAAKDAKLMEAKSIMDEQSALLKEVINTIYERNALLAEALVFIDRGYQYMPHLNEIAAMQSFAAKVRRAL